MVLKVLDKKKEKIMRFLIKKTPDRFLKSVNDEISSILSRNMEGLFPDYGFPEEEKMAMPVELKEKDKEYTVKAELPGVKKENVDIDIDKNYITINAKKEEEHEESEKGYKKSEFSYGEFSRTVYFPQEINVEKTRAKLEHGVLKIEAPKKEAEKENIKKLSIE